LDSVLIVEYWLEMVVALVAGFVTRTDSDQEMERGDSVRKILEELEGKAYLWNLAQ
jgi:hypothetical protein